MTKHIGSCSCGEIEFCFEGEPINSIFCYCKACQAMTGSDKWFGLWVAKNNFTFTKGQPMTYTRAGASGKAVHHLFCGTCSEVLCGEVTIGNFYSVSATSLTDNPFSPQMAIYTASAPKWAVMPDALPRFEYLPPGMGK